MHLIGSETDKQPGGTLSVRLQFLPAQYGGDWAIDDVYIDPYAK